MEKAIILKKMALLLPQGESEEVVDFAAQRSIEMVKSFCAISTIPSALLGVCTRIAIELLKAEQNSIKSIQEGLVTVTFQEQNKIEGKSEKAILDRFSIELNQWRRLDF